MQILKNHYFRHSLQPNLMKNVTLNANTKEIITLDTVYDPI